jgi:hypothetical protein
MTMTYSPFALNRLFPQGAKYHWRSPYIYENLEWNDEDVAKPTEAEIAAVNDEVILDAKFKTLRTRRDQLLTETDWVTLKAIDDSNDGLGIQLPQVWMDYRQALRDLPANTVDPANPVWPTKPGGN